MDLTKIEKKKRKKRRRKNEREKKEREKKDKKVKVIENSRTRSRRDKQLMW